jgi:UDP-2-acetamido-2,6-beta-L-arabino-hexul-4-ose reductase
VRILVTGAKGFIGRNLVVELTNQGYSHVLKCDIDTDPGLLEQYCGEADFVFHLAGVNRPKDPWEFVAGNQGVTENLLQCLKRHKNVCPIVYSSSIQAALDNPYGRSKRLAEELLFAYGDEVGARVLVYRFPNVFGKWCRPNYNSVVATFCHSIARGLPVSINDPSAPVTLTYIDDVVAEMINALKGKENRVGKFCEVPVVHTTTVGEIAELIRWFERSRKELAVPDMADDFVRKLYSTYLTYLPEDQFSYSLRMNVDHRGSFTEFLKTQDRGQVSINVSKPGVVKGNHWHHTKNEKFLVVRGTGVIRLRRVGSDEVIEYHVSGDKLEVVDIPPGYTHNIENLGTDDMVTVMWASECFDPEREDTYRLEV